MPKPEKPAASPKGDAKANGPDHPTQSEHAKALYEKLHGASSKHNEHPAGGPPNKPKGGGFNQFGGGKHGGPKSGPPRRTQAKGG